MAMVVLLAWALLALVLTGCGSLVLSRPGRPAAALEAFWVGLGLFLAWGNLWHLVRPLDVWVWVVPMAAAALGWWRSRVQPIDPWLAVAVALVAVWVAGHALTPLSSPDAGMYYVQVSRWYADAAAVPGLGNLNPYAVFNHAFFVLPAAFGVGPFHDHGWHLVNGLLVVGAMVLPLDALVRLIRREAELTFEVVFCLMLAARLVDAVLLMPLSGPTADVGSLAMGTFLLARAVNRPSQPAWVSGVLLATLLSLKVTQAGVVLAAALAEWRFPERWKWHETALAAALGAVCLLPWLVHGFVLSGYLFYPIAALHLPVDWAVPAETARTLQQWGWAFARWPGHTAAEVQAVGWVSHWLEVELLQNRDFLLPAGASVLGLVGLGLLSFSKRPPWRELTLVAAVGAGLLVWWFTVPAIRFAGPLLWAFAGALLGVLAEGLGRRRYLIGLLVTALVLGGFLGPEPAAQWASAVPPIPQSYCAQAPLSTGELVCQAFPNRPCFEKLCARTPASEIGTRVVGDFTQGFRSVK